VLADAEGDDVVLEVLGLEVLEHATKAEVAMTASATPAALGGRLWVRRGNTGVLSEVS
jgi:hypothetical protein